MMISVMLETRREMRATLALDDELLGKAEFYTGIREKSVLARERVKALVERDAARRLARLGSSEPDLDPPVPSGEAVTSVR
jgi:hypothetical protein